MPLIARALFAVLFATLASPSLAEDDIPESIDVTADLSVSADGKIVELEFVRKLSAELEQFLRERVQTWTIKPARRNGRAVGGDTALQLRLSIEPDGDQVLVRVASASTGPRYAETVPPKYPSEALRTRRQAILMVTVDVRADGTAGAMSSRMLAGKGSEKAFIAAAERSIRQWRFVPERVDGVPVATQVQVPMSFHLSGMPRLEMPVLAAGLPVEPNTLIAESEFELVGDVVGRKL